ncbi:AAA family ATPase [Tepidibacillus sp. LV47]|uniref:ATP-binding protein n=1 Tax=Tepidibacillus sp. LV47 TaxID=3398228 RepID=UPI003AAA2A9E
MWIESLEIYGFGKLADKKITLKQGLNLIEGFNEAGKSTIRAFIQAILFGFENRRNLHLRYEPLNGGKFGGAISIVDEKGQLYRIERVYHQKISGDVRIYLPNGNFVGEEYLPNLLHQINEKVYRQIFSFGLNEIQHLDTLQDQQINSFLYHAGTGLAKQILNMNQELTKKEQELFKVGGKKPIINSLLTEMDELLQKINHIKNKNRQYEEIVLKIEQLTSKIDKVDKKIVVIKQELNRYEKAAHYFHTYQNVKEMEWQLSEYAEEPIFPENGIERLEMTESKINEYEIEKKHLETKVFEMKEEAKELKAQLLTEQQIRQIEYMRDHLPYYQQNKKRLVQIQKDWKLLNEKIEENQKLLGSFYSEKTIRSFELPIAEKQTLQTILQQLDTKEKELFTLDLKLNELESRLHSNRFNPQEIEVDKKRKQRFAFMKNSSWLKYLIPTIGILSSVFYLYHQQWVTAGWFIILFFLVGRLLFHHNQLTDQQINQTRNEEMRLEKEISKLMQTKEKIKEEYEKQIVLWQNWLQSQGLQQDLSSITVYDTISLIQKMKDLYKEQDLLNEQIHILKREIKDYEALVAKIDGDRINPYKTEEIVYGWIQRYHQDQRNRSKLDQLNQRIKEIKEESRRLEERIYLLQEQIRQLFQHAKVTNKEDFYFRFKDYTTYHQLRLRYKQYLFSIRNGCSTEEEYQQLIQQLERTKENELIQFIKQRKEQLTELQSKLKEYLEKKGELQNQLKEIEEDKSLTVLQQEYSVLKSRLHENVKNWVKVAIAKYLLQQTMKTYEMEKQPEVIKKASAYFRLMTGKHYKGVFAPLDEAIIKVVRSDGQIFEPQYLSRGTIEQLFIALRFALIDEFAKKVNLPLIFDDIFVNFDPKRLQNTLNSLTELSKRHQILFFTCHPHLVSLMKEMIGNIYIIRL